MEKRKIFDCEYCKKQFWHKGQRNQHRKIHLPRADYKCTECNYTTNFKTHLNSHMPTHGKDESLLKFKCTICPYKTGRQQYFKRHMKVHSEVNNKYSCPLCPYQAKSKGRVTMHEKLAHWTEKPIKCPASNCEFFCKKKKELTRHMLSHSDERPFVCTFSHCIFKSKHKDSLNRHLKIHREKTSENSQGQGRGRGQGHEGGAPADAVASSSQSCTSTRNPRTHPKKCRKDLPRTNFKCSKCEFTTDIKSRFRHHNRAHKMKETSPKYKCELCPYKTWFRRMFEKHVAVHSEPEVNKYTCPSCPYQTIYKVHMTLHEKKVHWTKKPVECPIVNCKFFCKKRKQLTQHMKTHSQEKRFVCQVPHCSYKAKYKGSLTKHEKVHCEKSSVNYTHPKNHGSNFQGNLASQGQGQIQGPGGEAPATSSNESCSPGGNSSNREVVEKAPLTHVQWSVDWGSIGCQKVEKID